MSTPDVSLVFDLAFDGLTAAYDAELTVDWAEVRKSSKFAAGATLFFVGATSNAPWTSCDGPTPFACARAAAARPRRRCWTPPTPRSWSCSSGRWSPIACPRPSAAASSVNWPRPWSPAKLSRLRRSITGFGAHAGYQRKELTTEGTSVLSLHHRASVERHSLATFNIGDVYKRYRTDPNFFRAVNLGDATFQQREVHVFVDGNLAADFGRHVNSVTVTLRKAAPGWRDHDPGGRARRQQDRTGYGPAHGVRLERRHRPPGLDRVRVPHPLELPGRRRCTRDGLGTGVVRGHLAERPYQLQTISISGSGAALKARKVRSVSVEVEYPSSARRAGSGWSCGPRTRRTRRPSRSSGP